MNYAYHHISYQYRSVMIEFAQNDEKFVFFVPITEEVKRDVLDLENGYS